MQCRRCRHENPPQAKFCLQCGTRFALQCSKCGTELPAGARFCLECGQALSPSSPTGQPRYTTPESYTPKHLTEKILTSRSALEGERKQILVYAYRNLGFVSLRRGAIPQAIPPLERAVELCRMAQVRSIFDVTAAHLGYAYALSGRLPEGVTLMEEALADPEATGTIHRPLLLAYLGEAHLRAGRRNDAVAVARSALDLAHRQKERGNEAWVLRLLGDIAAHANPPEPDSAEGHYTQALARADELGMRPLAAHCHFGLGTLYRGTGHGVKAQEHLTTAARMYGEMDMNFWLKKAEAELGASP